MAAPPHLDSSSHPWLEAYLSRLVDEPDLDRLVHPSDEMLLHAQLQAEGDRDAGLLSYFEDGRQILQVVDQLVDSLLGGYQGVSAMLDFGCGFGRFTRWLLRRLPPEKVWAADVLAQSVAFQRDHFGLPGLLSVAEPQELSLPRPFDFIWVGSLFTHLPEETFGPWLERLLSALGPDGTLAFTVHDASLVPSGYRLPDNGILFLEDSESALLSKTQYGSCWVSEAFVGAQLEAATKERAVSWRRIPRGVCRYQDLYVVGQGSSGGQLSDFSPDVGPLGGVEKLIAEAPDRESLPLRAEGWASYGEGSHHVEAIELWLDGVLVDCCDTFGKRVDLVEIFGNDSVADSAFVCSANLPVPLDRASVLLGVIVRSSSGRRWPLYLGGLEAGVRYVQRQNLEASLRDKRSRQRHIDWMQSSRFWQLRERWFAAKRALGITDEM